ncbi:MAG: hypothetical protein LIO62_03535 [Clostridiales bacterium]|nr:hypothetical protein [Clostridiales bacterium]
MTFKKFIAVITALTLGVGFTACSAKTDSSNGNSSTSGSTDKSTIEATLNIANNTELTWTYSSSDDAWVMSIVSAVANPELSDYQGVSVAVPGAYVTGIDTDGDGTADITADNYSEEINGVLIIDNDAAVTSENGQVYTASTAPVIINTGAAGYSAQENQLASTSNCKNGYINVACGNRGKQSTATDEDGNTYYTGDAPDCLVDQKNAIRFVKYNILLGNLPGNTEYFVSTGGSGGGAHATMVAATSNNSVYYDYEIAQGAVGVYKNSDDSYSTTVTINGTDYEISDGVWGCVAYSAITSLAEADMAMAFEYYLDTDYSFNTDFQKQVAKYLSEEYMTYINEKNLTVDEASVGFDLDSDGDMDDTVALTIEYDEEKYADTNGYGGTYLTLYLSEFISNLQWYVDNLDYSDGWTWFDSDGNALSDDDVASMTSLDKVQAFIDGRYAKSSSDGDSEMGGDLPGGASDGELPSGDLPDGEIADGDMPDGAPDGDMPSGDLPDDIDNSDDSVNNITSGMGDEVGTPDAGTTQGTGSGVDSSNYSTFEEMLEAYEADIAEIEDGDEYGNNQVTLYDPLNYIGADTTENPTWARIMMGASEGDMSMFSSLNLQIAWLNAGTDATIEWQWDGGHVPSEIFGESLSLTVDTMYGEYVDGAVSITKAEAQAQTENGTATEATGTDISDWVNVSDDGEVSFSLADAVSYRTNGASKAIPGFDVIDYGQETYEFGSSTQDARHFDKYVLKVFEEHQDELSELFTSDKE